MDRKKIRPLVSVIIPAYNAEKYIAESLDSILNQSYSNLEVVIINDASTDNTLKIINSYCDKDTRVKVYINKTNVGIGMNRARGIELANGEYICWQDADDVSLPNRILNQLNYLLEHDDVGIVGGFLQFFDESGNGVVRRYHESDAALRKNIFRYNPVAQPASMVRAEVYKNVGTYSGEYTVSEDLEMLFRIGTKYHFANIQKVVLRYRQSANSLTRSNLRRMENATLRLRKQYSKNHAYDFSFLDGLYNIAQYLSMFLPVNIRMFIFGIIRGDK